MKTGTYKANFTREDDTGGAREAAIQSLHFQAVQLMKAITGPSVFGAQFTIFQEALGFMYCLDPDAVIDLLRLKLAELETKEQDLEAENQIITRFMAAEERIRSGQAIQ